MLNIPEEIKDLLHLDSWKKNIRIHFPDGERSDICNDQIVMDSVQFTESLCSQSTLKFGICESPIFQCEVVGVGNIKGASIEVYCEVYCDASVEDAVWQNDLQHYVYQILYGVFVVDSCKRQADMIYRKIVAYSGAARVASTCPIIKFKDSLYMNSAVAYQPNIFASFINIASLTQRIGDLAHTEVTPTYNSRELVYNRKANMIGATIYFSIVCKVIRFSGVDDANANKLYFLEFPKVTGGSQWTYPGLYSLGDDPLPGNDKDFSSWFCAQKKGLYIYPYQGYASVGYIYIPHKLRTTIEYLHEEPVITETVIRDPADIKFYEVDISEFPWTLNVSRSKAKYWAFPNKTKTGYVYDPTKIDYIKAFEAVLELHGYFGSLNRQNGFNLVNIRQQFNLNPDTDLYPDSSLYPEGVVGGKLLPQDYQSCWYEDDYTKPFGAVICKYKDSSNDDNEYTYYLSGFDETSPLNSYQIYYINDNYLIQSRTWTESQIDAICAAIASNIENVTYMPVDFKGRGLPYVEIGDTFEILTRSNDSIITIVLYRTIKGELNLVDSYKSV